MTKKIFVFDLDGTALTTEDNYLPETLEAIKKVKKQNHYAIVATGRPLEDIFRIGKKFYQHFDFLVCNNGTYHHNVKTQESFFDKLVPSKIANDLFDLGKTNDCFFILNTTNKLFRTKLIIQNQDLEKTIWKNEWTGFHFVPSEKLNKEIANNKITQCSLKSSEKNIQKFFDIFASKYRNEVQVRISGKIFVDVNPLNTSKWQGIKQVAEKLNVDLKNVITFGDSGNDVEMLANAKLSFAPENGTKEAKQAAKHIIKSNLTIALSEKVLELLRSQNG